MAIRYFNLSIRNLAWRLRKFDEILGEFLVQEIKNHSEEIVSLVTQKQLYEKGINGKNIGHIVSETLVIMCSNCNKKLAIYFHICYWLNLISSSPFFNFSQFRKFYFISFFLVFFRQ